MEAGVQFCIHTSPVRLSWCFFQRPFSEFAALRWQFFLVVCGHPAKFPMGHSSAAPWPICKGSDSDILFIALALWLMSLLLESAVGSSLESTHSLRYYYLGLSEPSQGRPWFTQDGYIDDLRITHYDSATRKDDPQFSWVKNMEEEDVHFWEKESGHARKAEEYFKEALLTLQNHYNHSGGLHVWQCRFDCEQDHNGSRGGSMQFAYDGKDFISLELETPTWIAAVAQAQKTKKKWENNGIEARFWKNYLENDCVMLLRKYLHYGKEALPRKEPPKMTMTPKMEHDNNKTIICRIDGFYPRDIHVVWKKDGEVWEQETLHGVVAPNSDGTYYTWISVKIDPKNRGYFQCCMDHSSLKEPLDFFCKKHASPVNLGIKIGCIGSAFILTGLLTLLGLFNLQFCTFFCRRTPRQEAAALEIEAERIPEVEVVINDDREDRARFLSRLHKHRCTSVDELP